MMIFKKAPVLYFGGAPMERVYVNPSKIEFHLTQKWIAPNSGPPNRNSVSLSGRFKSANLLIDDKIFIAKDFGHNSRISPWLFIARSFSGDNLNHNFETMEEFKNCPFVDFGATVVDNENALPDPTTAMVYYDWCEKHWPERCKYLEQFLVPDNTRKVCLEVAGKGVEVAAPKRNVMTSDAGVPPMEYIQGQMPSSIGTLRTPFVAMQSRRAGQPLRVRIPPSSAGRQEDFGCTAGEDIAINDFVFVSDNGIARRTDPIGTLRIPSVGIAMEAASPGRLVRVRIHDSVPAREVMMAAGDGIASGEFVSIDENGIARPASQPASTRPTFRSDRDLISDYIRRRNEAIEMGSVTGGFSSTELEE